MDNELNLNNDIEDSEIIPFEALAWEEPEKYTRIYFYKAKSYIKEQKARIVLENQSTSILCIETDLSNDPNDLESYFSTDNIINGFSTIGVIQNKDIKNQALNYYNASSIDLRQLISPVILINLPIQFLKDDIYFISFIDLSKNKINYDELFIIDKSTIEFPELINKNDLNQLPVNTLELVPIPVFNATRNYSISVNITKPISIKNLLNIENKIEFTMNNDLILFSNIQCFVINKLGNEEIINSAHIDIYKYLEAPKYVTSKYPIKISFQNNNIVNQFTNEWNKFVLPWRMARDYIEQNDLETLLIIKRFPIFQQVYNNFKFKQIDIIGNIKYNISGEKNGKQTINDEWEVLKYYLSIIKAKNLPPYTNLKFLDIDLQFSGNDDLNFEVNKNKFFEIDENGKSIIIIDEKEIEIKNSEILFNQPIYMDIKVSWGSSKSKQEDYFDYPILNLNLLSNPIIGTVKSGINNLPSLILQSYPEDKNLKKIDTKIYNAEEEIRGINILIKLNSNHIYSRLVTKLNLTDKFILVKFMKRLLMKTINYRLGFPGREYDGKGNPSNDMARLHAEFEVTGNNPLQVISNEINSFLALNPWIVNVDEWKTFMYCLFMISRNIYSIYSINNGVRGDEELALPYYFEMATAPIILPNGVYDYPSLNVILKSKYFDLEGYNDKDWDNQLFSKFPKFDKMMTIENDNIRISLPFLNGSLLTNDNIKAPQKVDIENEDFQRYLLFLIHTRDLEISKYKSNKEIFDLYMDELFNIEGNYSDIKNKWDNLVCGINCRVESNKNTIIGDLPIMDFIVTNDIDSDLLICKDNSINIEYVYDEYFDRELLISKNNSIIIDYD